METNMNYRLNRIITLLDGTIILLESDSPINEVTFAGLIFEDTVSNEPFNFYTNTRGEINVQYSTHNVEITNENTISLYIEYREV